MFPQALAAPDDLSCERSRDLRELVVTTVPGDRGEVFAPSTEPVRIGTCGEQCAHDRRVSLSHREVQRFGVAGQVRITREQPLQRPVVADSSSLEGIPHVAPAAAPRTVGLDRGQLVGPN